MVINLKGTCDGKNLKALQIPSRVIEMVGKCSCPNTKAGKARNSKRKLSPQGHSRLVSKT